MGNQINSLFNKIFDIHEKKNKLKISGKGITFLNNKYKAEYFYEKHIFYTYRVKDTTSNQLKNLKIIQTLNDNQIKNTITQNLNLKYLTINTPFNICIKEFYFDDSTTGTRNKHNLNLILIEEPIDYITLKDFLIILIENTTSEDRLHLRNLFTNEFIKYIFITMIQIVDTMHKFQIFNFNMNLFSLVIVRNKDKFELKLSDFEIPYLINLNLKEKNTDFLHAYFETLDKKECENFMSVFFQIIFTLNNLVSMQVEDNNLLQYISSGILNKKSPIEITNYIHSYINDEIIQIFIDKILNNILSDLPEFLNESDMDLLKFYYLLVKQDENSVPLLKSVIKENLNENSSLKFKKSFTCNIDQSNLSQTHSLKTQNKDQKINTKILNYINIIFIALKNDLYENNNIIDNISLLTNNEVTLIFILLNAIKENFIKELVIFLLNDLTKYKNNYFYLLIQKYTIFIQSSYKILKLDFLGIINLVIENFISNENIYDNITFVSNLKTAGLFSFILCYINNCDIDFTNFYEIINKISLFNTCTISSLIDKTYLSLNLQKLMLESNQINQTDKICSISINEYNKNFLNNKSEFESENNSKIIKSFDRANLMRLKIAVFNLTNIFSSSMINSFSVLNQNKKFYHINDIFNLIMKIPIIKLNKYCYYETLNFLNSYFNTDYQEDFLEEQSYNLLLSLILKFLFFKRNIRASYIYSTCIMNSICRDFYPKEAFLESGALCSICKIKVCLVCAHRCHQGHGIISLGYCDFICECNQTGECSAYNSLDIPLHIRKINSKFEENLSKNDRILAESKTSRKLKSCRKSIELDLAMNFKNSNLANSQISQSLIQSMTPPDSDSNVYMSFENETHTIVSKLAICEIKDNEFNNIDICHEKDNSNIKSEIENKILISEYQETLYYFEIQIILGGYYDQIAIGVTCDQDFPLNELAGYHPNSIGYHGDDGRCYVNSTEFDYGIKFGSNDIIGCGVTSKGNVYYTHNGCILPLLETKLRGNIYYTVSLRGKYSSVKINHMGKFIFKHIKQCSYRNPSSYIDYSNKFAKILTEFDFLIKFLHDNFKIYSFNSLIRKKFKILSLILKSHFKKDKKYLLQYLHLTKSKKSFIDTIHEVDDEIKISPNQYPIKKENEKINFYNSNKDTQINNANEETKEIPKSNAENLENFCSQTNRNEELLQTKKQDLNKIKNPYFSPSENINSKHLKEQNVCKCGKSTCSIF